VTHSVPITGSRGPSTVCFHHTLLHWPAGRHTDCICFALLSGLFN